MSVTWHELTLCVDVCAGFEKYLDYGLAVWYTGCYHEGGPAACVLDVRVEAGLVGEEDDNVEGVG